MRVIKLRGNDEELTSDTVQVLGHVRERLLLRHLLAVQQQNKQHIWI